MDISVFFTPTLVALEDSITDGKNRLYNAISRNENNHFPDLEGVKVALIGVQEDRKGIYGAGSANGPDAVRKRLYQLFKLDSNVQIADLGNIFQGERYEDTQFALEQTVEFLLKKDIIPLIIGGSQDLTLSIYKGYGHLEQTVNLVTIDSRLDFGEQDDEFNDTNYLNQIVLHQPNYLFNYSNIGHQRYFVDPELLELMDKLFFDTLRLGVVNENLWESEPILRQADLVSLDLNSIRKSEMPGNESAGPNGLYAEKVCQMARYSGISDKLSSFGVFGYDPLSDPSGAGAELVAEILWCFLDGVKDRKSDSPIGDKKDFIKYTVHSESHGHNLIFYKSEKSDRWWMDVPYPAGQKNKYERHHLVPCTYTDYQRATNEDIPDRWWKTYQKLT
ncbi:MAG: formiminoglutamase [Flavobacteriales bacterium]|jgi:formiminoglutamase